METFRISKKTNEVNTTTPLEFEKIITSGNDLCLIADRNKTLGLSEGGKLHFEKFASGNTGQMIKVCEEDSTIRTIIDSGDTRNVYFDYVYTKILRIASFRKIDSGATDGYSFKFYFTTDHSMLPCDIENQKFYVRRGNSVVEFSGLALCYPGGVVKGENISGETNDCCSVEGRLFNYETMERNSILAKKKKTTSGTEFEPAPGDEVLFETNAYFHILDDGTVLLYNCPGEFVNVCRYTNFMGLGVMLKEDDDMKRMFQEYQVNELFVKKIKNSIIPGFIDLEKLKYAPAFIETDTGETEEKTFLATGLTFNLHFRTRISGETKYTFEDTWHFDDEMTTWNGNGGVDGVPVKREDLYSNEEFVNSSNLVGWLGFTDDDIYNQKNRVSRSFLRLSFYDGTNPLTQSLLYYSTIFMDSGDLYGKYVKRKAWLESIDDDYDQNSEPVVWSSGSPKDPCSAVTCQFIVNDEYDMTRSGEGFNLYLFRQDAPVENEVQDIYMKVEFNHAGIGRTIPLIFWRKDDNGEPAMLTMNNYNENTYVPIRIQLTEKGYVYSFPDSVQVKTNSEEQVEGRDNGIIWESDRLIFNLFEPMIELETEE